MFHLDNNDIYTGLWFGKTFTEPFLSDYAALLRAMGPEAKELRRLTVTVDTEPYEIGEDDNPDDDANWPDALEAEDAERELESLHGLLHPNITIFLAICQHLGDNMKTFHFRCTMSQDGDHAFVATKLENDGFEKWREYLEEAW
jgi:Rieske Fe-S protein